MEILLVGAGLMGSQIGCEYAFGGHSVTFLARDRARARARVDQVLRTAADLGLPGAGPEAAERIAFAAGPAGLDHEPGLIVESLPEDLALKAEILAPLAEAHPGATIASNTSSISLTELGEGIGVPARVVGTHYWNPPLLMPLVEVVRGAETGDPAVELVCELLDGLGKETVLVEKDVPGFVWNRLQAALLREALWLVENGVASPATIDRVVSSGLGRRFRRIGLFEAVALGGTRTWNRVAENLFPQISNEREAGDLERWLTVKPEELGAVEARRDHALARDLRQDV